MKPTQSLLNFADHITTVLSIEDVKIVSQSLFNIGLPQAWPLAEQPGFSTVGIRFGNINLELCCVDRRSNSLNDWLTFEPVQLDTLAEDLANRNIQHEPFDAVVVHGQPIYTRVGLSELEQGTTAIQLCHLFYQTRTSGPIAPANAAGIRSVSSVNIELNTAHQDILSRLLELKDLTSTITFKEGPNLNITPATKLNVDGLTIIADDI